VTAGDLRVGTVVVNVLDMDRGVAFWSAALDYETREAAPDPEFTMLQPRSGSGVPVSLQLTDQSSTSPGRLHLSCTDFNPVPVVG
jgi:hypothetical protein